MSADGERFVWRPGMLERVEGTVELTPADERRVDELLEEEAFDVGRDDNDGFSWSDLDR
jgi:hypothetical protein